MTKPRLFSSFVLLAVLLASCAPAAVTESPVQPVDPVAVEPSATSIPNVDQASTPAVDLTATPLSDVIPVATSRGPDLHATDPTTVSLASGGIQFVEFFRFT